jgi:hypothetical protein
MTTDYRAMCVELVDALDSGIPAGRIRLSPLADRARALLAHPVAVGPSDEVVEAAARVIYGSMRFERIDSTPQWEPHGNSHAQDEARRCARALLAQPVAEGPTDEEWDELVVRAWDQYETVGYQGERFMYDSDFGNALDLVRQELTHWGHPTPQPQPPADGEVGELVEWLQKDGVLLDLRPAVQARVLRTAELLQHLESDNAGLTAAADSAFMSLLDY